MENIKNKAQNQNFIWDNTPLQQKQFNILHNQGFLGCLGKFFVYLTLNYIILGKYFGFHSSQILKQ